MTRFASIFLSIAIACISLTFSTATKRDLSSLFQLTNYSYSGLELTLHYNVSDHNGFVGYALYHKCMEGALDVTEDEPLSQFVVSETLERNGDNQVTLTLTMDPSTIDASSIHSTTAVEQEDLALVSLCVRFSLYNNNDDDGMNALMMEVDFIETQIALTVDAADIETVETIRVEPKEKDNLEENKQYDDDAVFQVLAYECDANNNATTSSAPRNQGSALRICVAPTTHAREMGVRMRRINFFDFKRENVVTQPAIEPEGREASNGLTVLECDEGSIVCAFETLLEADFFFATGTVRGSGEALLVQYSTGDNDDDPQLAAQMSFGAPDRRFLRSRNGSAQVIQREANLAGDESASDFTLEFQVT